MTATRRGVDGSGAKALHAWLWQPVDVASLAAFRILFGLLMLGAVVRFWAKGWIYELYIAPRYHFAYYGFEWVRPWPSWGMYLHFALLGLAAACIAAGYRYRLATLLFFVGFTYVELLDKTTYLNHYYLISIVAAMLFVLPAGRAWSLDARRRRIQRGIAPPSTTPRWTVLAIQLQLAIVYLFAGAAKLQGDWLIHAQPLTTWLSARADLPLIGRVLQLPGAAYAFSWAGALFDLTIPFFLCWRRTRPYGYAAVIAFHLLTGALFHIGIFPWAMIALTTIFFAPGWPRRFVPGGAEQAPAPAATRADCAIEPERRWTIVLGLLAVHFALQLFLPLRHHLYPGNHLWTNRGFRFAWHVMVIEKTGMTYFHVREPKSGKRWMVAPERYLTPLQVKMMATQPDMIVQFARYLEKDFRARGFGPVSIHAESYAALNGRPSQRLIAADAELTRRRDGTINKPWVVPLGHEP